MVRAEVHRIGDTSILYLLCLFSVPLWSYDEY
jgi:hypothetical protein